MGRSEAARLDSVETRNNFYRSSSEHDKLIDDSNRAQLCFRFADLALQGADLFDAINSLDEDWRMLIADPANEVRYDEAFEQRVLRLYRSWLETSKGVLQAYDTLRDDYVARGFDQDHIERIQSGVREVEGILTPDSEFYSELWMKRDSAIDEHRNGTTTEAIG